MYWYEYAYWCIGKSISISIRTSISNSVNISIGIITIVSISSNMSIGTTTGIIIRLRISIGSRSRTSISIINLFILLVSASVLVFVSILASTLL